MAVYSSSMKVLLIEECLGKSSWIFDPLPPVGLFLYRNSKLEHAFYLDEQDSTLFPDDSSLFDEKLGMEAWSLKQKRKMACLEHPLGTFVLVVGANDLTLKVDQEILQEVLNVFCFNLDLLKNQKSESQTHRYRHMSTEKLLLQLLHSSDYFNQTGVLAHFVNYMAKEMGEPSALFLYDRLQERFVFHHASSESFGLLFNQNNLTDLETVSSSIPSYLDLKNPESPYYYLNKMMSRLLPDKRYYLIPIKRDSHTLALLLVGASEPILDLEMERITSIVNDVAKYLEEIHNYTQYINNGKRYKQLFSVTTKFHSTMDQQEILEEVVDSINELYPGCQVQLVVTDHGLEPLNKHPVAMDAFLKGELRVNHEKRGSSTIYAPLKGRQGVYGVFIIKTPVNSLYMEEELSFIQLQATTAGHALENAKLYQQSQRSISDLQLINQASERINSELRTSEAIRYLVEQIIGSFHAEEVGFIVKNEGETWEINKASTSYFFTHESEEFVERLSFQIKQEEESLFLGDLGSEVGWKDVHFRSLMAIPMKQEGDLMGFVVALHKNPYQFTFDAFKVIQALVHHSTLALINARLREELEQLVITDQLTKLYSRSYLNERINASFLKDHSGVLLLIDLDNFKTINDQYGHLVGDQVLIQVARILEGNVRREDIAARWGGEELAVYFPNLTKSEGKEIASRIVKIVEAETRPSCTISCGLSVWQKDVLEKTNNKLFSEADQALYFAKSTGKNRIEIS